MQTISGAKNIGIRTFRDTEYLMQQAEFARSLAIVIGINSYDKGYKELLTAVSDAKWIGGLLEEKHGYSVECILDKDATTDRLTSLFESGLTDRVGPNDRLLIYFAGHGEPGVKGDLPQGFLVPVDAARGDQSRRVSMETIWQALQNLECRHTLLVLDCCYAGLFRSRDTVPVQTVIHRERYQRYASNQAWYVLTSCTADQKALDGLLVDDHSPFATALHHALSGDADRNPPREKGKEPGDGLITTSEIYSYVDEWMSSFFESKGLRQLQTPFLSVEKGEGEYFFLTPGRELDLPSAPPLDPANNPYRGLDAYHEDEGDLFFGREELVEKLRRRIEAKDFIVVLGWSGSGKSSFVRAGVLNSLKESGWSILPTVYPGSEPMATLEKSLAGYVAQTPNTVLVIDQLEEMVTKCPDQSRRLSFAHRLGELSAQGLHIVCTLRTDFEPAVRDYFGDLWQGAGFSLRQMTPPELRTVIERPAAARCLYIEPSLVDDLVNEVAQLPGGLALLSFTLSELYRDLVARAISGEAKDRSMTREAYERMGRVAGSLDKRATDLYNTGKIEDGSKEDGQRAWDDSQKATMRRVMLRMVSVDAGVARRGVTEAELKFELPGEDDRVQTILRILERSRLVVKFKPEAALQGKTEEEWIYEPAHDALVNAWKLLSGWIAQVRENLPLMRRLTLATEEWIADGKSSRALWNDDPRLKLAELRGFHKVMQPEDLLAPNRHEHRFLVESRNRENRDRFSSKAIPVAVSAVFGVLTLLSGYWTVRAQIEKAEVNRKLGLERIREGEFAGFSTLGSAASSSIVPFARWISFLPDCDVERFYKTVEFRRSEFIRLTSYFRGIPVEATVDKISQVADISPLGDAVAVVGTRDQTNFVRISSLVDGKVEDVPTETQVNRLSYSRDGKLLVMAESGGQTQIWMKNQGVVGKTSTGESPSVIAISGDGKSIAVGGQSNQLCCFDSSGAPTWEPRHYPADLVGLQFSPDGSKLMVVLNESEESWGKRGLHLQELSAKTGVELRPKVPLGEETGGVGSTIRYSPDGERLWLTLGNQFGKGHVLELDATTLNQVDTVRHGAIVGALEISPDGLGVLTGAEDFSARLWDTANRLPSTIPLRHNETVDFVSFFREGRMMATGSRDAFVQLWTRSGVPIGPKVPHESPLKALRLFDAKDSCRLVTVTERGTVRCWDLPLGADWVEPRTATGLPVASDSQGTLFLANEGGKVTRVAPNGVSETAPLLNVPVQNLAAHPDGSRVLVVGRDGKATLFNSRLKEPVELSMKGVWSAVIARHGDFGVAALKSGEVLKFGLNQEKFTVVAKHSSRALLLGLSANDKWLLSAGTGKEAALTRLSDGMRAELPHKGRVSSSSFREGSDLMLATGSWDGAVRLWDLRQTSPRMTEIWSDQAIEGRQKAVYTVAWNPDGNKLAVGRFGGEIKIWDFSGTELPKESTTVIRLKTPQSVSGLKFSPDGKYLLCATRDGMLSIFDVDNAKQAWGYSPAISPDAWRVFSGLSRPCQECEKLSSTESIAWLGGHFLGEFFDAAEPPLVENYRDLLQKHAGHCANPCNAWATKTEAAPVTPHTNGQAPSSELEASEPVVIRRGGDESTQFNTAAWDKAQGHLFGSRALSFKNWSSDPVEISTHFWPGQYTQYRIKPHSTARLPYGYSGGWGIGLDGEVRSIAEVADLREGTWEVSEGDFWR